MHSLTGWRISQRIEGEVDMSGSGSTFVTVATYPDAARGMSRSEAKQLGDFIGQGQAGPGSSSSGREM